MQLKGISAGLSLQTSSWQIYEISRWGIDRLESSPTILVHLIEGMHIINFDLLYTSEIVMVFM